MPLQWVYNPTLGSAICFKLPVLTLDPPCYTIMNTELWSVSTGLAVVPIDTSTNVIVINLSAQATTGMSGNYLIRYTLDNGATVDSNSFQIDITTIDSNSIDDAMAHCIDCASTLIDS